MQKGDSVGAPGTRQPAGRSAEGDARGQAGHGDLDKTLRAMEQKLRQHSALEDLGPLFGPEAQGQGQGQGQGQAGSRPQR
jgi:hypothetical protein